MFITAPFTIAKMWKQPKCPSTEEWIKKMWYICMCIYIYIYTHTYICICIYIYMYKMKYCSAIKKNEILPFAVTWTDLEGIMQREISQTEKDTYCMISLICGI